jgi:hypothetical protein
MKEEIKNACGCNPCAESSCTCGCRSVVRETCACGPECRCEGACGHAKA